MINSISEREFNNICIDYNQRLNQLDAIYVQTIDVYLEMNCSVKATASYLHIHRNTLLYRLDQIKNKVGLDARIFNDAFILKIIRVIGS